MSQENVEIIRATLDTWNATRGIHATIDAFDPDVEFLDLQAVTGMQDRGRGPEELHRMAEQWKEIFDDWALEVRDLVDVGGEFVMADVRFTGVGRDSGAPVSNRQFEVYRLVAGKIAEIRFGFHDRAEALGWVAWRRRSAISQENVEIVRRGTDHFNETGEPPWELLDPEVEWTIDPPAWAAGTYRGHAELRDLARRIGEVFDEFRYDFDEYLHAGDRVVAIGAIRVRGAQSGAIATQQAASVSRLRDGRVVTVRIYLDRDQALRDTGLRE